MNEGGQSSTGQVMEEYTFRVHVWLTTPFVKLIDFIITTHPSYPELAKLAKERNCSIHLREPCPPALYDGC
jgi:hypothetical protein